MLDPFAGCATTLVAAEKLGRHWVGIDIWDGAHDIVLRRLEAEGLAAPDRATDRLFTFGDVIYATAPPVRTDDGGMKPYRSCKSPNATPNPTAGG